MSLGKAKFDSTVAAKAFMAGAPHSDDLHGSLESQAKLLALLGSPAPLTTLLEGVAHYVESWADGIYCTVLLADPTGQWLEPGAVPSLPAAFAQAVARVPIVASHGGCGTAAALREMVVVEDIENSPLQAAYGPLARTLELQAVWSVPILDESRELLGCLAMYHKVSRAPTSHEEYLIHFGGSLAAFVIRRHKDTENLRTGESLLRAAVGGADLGLWHSDSNGCGVWFDNWCERVDVDPCPGPNWEASWSAQIHADDRERFKASLLQCSRGFADQYVVEYRIRTRGGTWRWLQERGSVGARDANGRPLHYTGVCIDIDERKNAEFALRRSEERLGTLARLVPGFVFEGRLTPEHDLQFTWADDEFSLLFGCERQELNLRGWQTFVDPRDRAAAKESIAAVMAGATESLELRILAATGEKRWLRMAGEPVRDPLTGLVCGLIGMAEDITERKVLMEQMFESVNREQRRIGNDLHDGIGQVLTGASLLLLSCHTRAVRGQAVTPDEVDGVRSLITSAIESMRQLAHGLAPGALDCGGLASALENLAEQSRQWSGLEISLSSTAGNLGTLDAVTSDHLFRIVQEAITNTARHAHARSAKIVSRVDAGALLIEVIDDGIGTSKEIARGFGLRTMRYRARAIGAELTIDAAQPRGTRVSIRLPLGSAV